MSGGGDWKAMFKAIQEGDLELVSYYLRTGVDPNYQHPEYMAAPLVESIRFNHFEITKLLLENGADPIIVEDAEGETAMVVAERKKNVIAIELLNEFIEQ